MKGVNYYDRQKHKYAVTGSESYLNNPDIFYTKFEPKTVSRFICHIPGIPSYLVKEVTRPKVSRTDGQWIWHPIQIKTYDPIVPSATQLFYEYLLKDCPAKFDMTIELLGPVGDSVEKWEIKNAEISKVDFGVLDWCGGTVDGKDKDKWSEPAEVTVTIIYDFAQLIY